MERVMNELKLKVKAICIFQQRDYIFVSKSFDSVEKEDYYRPIGGTTEFGEYSKETIIREIHEEMNAEIDNIELMKVIENIFVCDGRNGHEIVFLYRADFVDKAHYEMIEHQISESNGRKYPAYWIKIDDFSMGNLRLVPEGLIEYLK